jgi:hypothetical protein
MTWCEPGHEGGQLQRPVTEDWLRAHGFKIYGGRNDERLPVRRLPVGSVKCGGRQPFEAHDDLCIDVAPVTPEADEWFVWIARDEPYRHVHVRHVKFTWELARLFEGLTGHVWPGTL